MQGKFGTIMTVDGNSPEVTQDMCLQKKLVEILCVYIYKNVIEVDNVERLTMIRKRYIEYL